MPTRSSQGVGLLEVLRRQEDRHAQLLVQPPDLGPDRRPAVGVETRGGLVEKQHLWLVDQGRGEIEAPLHSARIGANAPVDGGTDVDQVEDLSQSHPDLRGTQPVEAALQREQFAAGLSLVDRCVLECDADPDPDRLGILCDVVPGYSMPCRQSA